jgi:hypothetical protein
MKWRTATVAVIVGLLLIGVAGQAMAQTPVVGTEKLAWDQQVTSMADLAAMKWMVYVDQLAGVPIVNGACVEVKGTYGFPCTGDIPSMTPGDHQIVLTAYMDVGGTKLESLKSIPFPVRMVIAPPAPVGVKIIRGSPGDN